MYGQDYRFWLGLVNMSTNLSLYGRKVGTAVTAGKLIQS